MNAIMLQNHQRPMAGYTSSTQERLVVLKGSWFDKASIAVVLGSLDSKPSSSNDAPKEARNQKFSCSTSSESKFFNAICG